MRTMTTYRLRNIEEAQGKCIEILRQVASIKISVGFIFEWHSVQDDKKVITQESMPAVSLDEESIGTGEWDRTWSLLEEQVAAISERNTVVSGLTFVQILEVKLNWIAYQERSTRSIKEARGVVRNGQGDRVADSRMVAGEEAGSRVENRVGGTPFVHQLFHSYRYSRGESVSSIRRMGENLGRFISRFSLRDIATSVANLSNITKLCGSVHGISIFVYNRRANIIFRKEVENATFTCNMYWNGERMLVINNLARFMGIQKQIGVYCHKCNRVHVKGVACEMQKIELGLYEQPVNKDGETVELNMYCDIEAMCPERGAQEACCFSLVAQNGANITIVEEMIKNSEQIESTEEASNELMRRLFVEVEQIIGKYFGWSGDGSTPITSYTDCTWCGQMRSCVQMRQVVVSRGEEAVLQQVCHSCYKSYKINRLYQPVIYFHNFSKYDICFVIRHLVREYRLGLAGKSTELVYNITCSEKKRRKQIGFRIRDSLHFVQGSVRIFAQQVSEQMWRSFDAAGPYYDLFMGSKGDFPYEWLQDRHQLFEQFPDNHEPQRNKLSGQIVSLAALRTFCQEKQINSAGEYLQKYCTVDVLILLLYFDNYRRTMLAEYNVDISLFYSISAVSWYLAMRNEAACQIPTSSEDYLSIRDNIRGGVAQAIKRYVQVGEGECVKMLDVNALYSWCMTQALPTKHIASIQIADDDTTDWMQKMCSKEDGETWLCLVDLEYPARLHDVHMHFFLPLAPHHFNNRLCTTFLPKTKYLVLDKLLLFYVQQGLLVTRWHSIQRWSNRTIFKQFVEDNINARNTSHDPTIKNVRKVTNNALYGKTCENVFRYKQFVIDKFERQPNANGQINAQARNWLNFSLIDTEFVVAEIARDQVLLNKPIQLGFTILELAKLRIYEFWLRVCRVFNTDVELLYTDTDSLLLYFKHPDPFTILRTDPETAPFVDLPVSSTMQDLPPLKTTGLFSDELYGKRVKAYVGLRAKSYVVQFDDESEKRRTKGVRPSALHNNQPLNFELFYESLFSDTVVAVEEFSIHKKNYRVRVEGGPRKALSNYDAKHYYAEDIVMGFPWGYSGEEQHQQINENI
uniref:DNA-directed DNA polymerase n=1 Tax=Vesanto virus TaxID=1955786 RepID=A0A7D4W3E0_9VIRU|nr:DNA polymerase B [Vesanto virus]